MALVLYSDQIKLSELDQSLGHWAYNSFDCCLTHEIFSALLPQLTSSSALTYSFERAMQGPALEMMLRGILVDSEARNTFIQELFSQAARLEHILQAEAEAVWGKGLNPNSPQQLKDFFYTHMKLPEQFIYQKGQKKLSTSRAALEKLQLYFYAQPIILCILALRDIYKMLSVLKSGVDSDGRMRTSFNPAATENWRWSSSQNAFGGGMNFQNPTDRARRIFIPDSKMKFAYLDLEQAESRCVAYLSEDQNYIHAVESGDLHTTTAQMIWPHLDWSQDPKHNRKVAEQNFYREFSYRDMSKRCGHGTSYYGKPFTISRILKVEQKLIAEFQDKFFLAFPGISRWHLEVARKLQLDGFLTTALGSTRFFFGRRDDDSTLREAIACEPQGLVGMILNLGLWRLWWASLHGAPWQIMSQLHDAVLLQYPEELEASVLPMCQAMLRVEVLIKGRTMVIPVDTAVGWNWAKAQPDPAKPGFNPGGLQKWKGPKSDSRSRPVPTSILDRVIAP